MLIFKKIFSLTVYLFAIVGFVLVGGFFAIRLNLTNTKGKVDQNNNYFSSLEENSKRSKILGVEDNIVSGESKIESLNKEIEKLGKIKKAKNENYCKIRALGNFFPINAKNILDIDETNDSDYLTSKVILAVNLQLLENQDFQSEFKNCENEKSVKEIEYEALRNKFKDIQSGENAFFWINSEEWNSIKSATAKDKSIIEKVSQMTGVDQRLLVSCLIGEQLRLFNSQRELFKKFFEPLKILGNANKISLGVMGIKETTAEQVEKNLKDVNSPYYLGREFENILDVSNEKTRYEKLVEEDHYFSYLYGAIYVKQIMKQWSDAGYDIKYRPEIVGTLFNVGFPQSKPKPDPKVGGSSIKINGKEYSFGRLSYEFYYSGELMDVFPFDTKQ